MKKIFLFAIMIFFTSPVYSIEYNELDRPKTIEERLGTTNLPETPIVIKTKSVWKKPKTIFGKKNELKNALTYADLSLKKISSDVLYDLDTEQAEITADLETLWMGTAKKSETIRYAIYKLSNPDEGKSPDTVLKKIIKPIASFSTIAGTAFSSNPFVASSALIGGSLLGNLGSGDSELNYKFTKVSDTGMVLLVRKIDKLQEKLLNSYLDYRKCEKIHRLALENLKKREIIYASSQQKSREELIIADVYYRNAQNFERGASTNLWSAKQTLIQLSGKEAFEAIEKKN